MLALKEKLAPICITATAVCVLALAGCGSNSNVAATVNGVEIPEDKVVEQIGNVRNYFGATDDEQWATLLNSIDYTPEKYREEVINNSLVPEELAKQDAEKRGIEVSDEELDKAVDDLRAQYESDEAFESALSQAGYTEESYREVIRESLVSQKYTEAIAEESGVTVDDDALLTEVKEFVDGYELTSMKRSSHILFAAEDEKTAKAVLEELNNGADFAELAKKHSIDTGSGAEGGDVGWDKMANFVSDYQDALDKLDKGETSGLVKSEYGIHIIRCTDVWQAPEKIKKLSDVPDDVVEIVREQLESQAQQDAYDKHIEELREKADIVINPMPEDAPYNVDMSKYVSSSTASEEADGDSSAAEDGEDSESDDASEEESESASESTESESEATEE